VFRLIIIWIHVVAATAWVGGVLYAGHLVVPAAGRGARDALALLSRGRIVAWGALGLLVVTGLLNLRGMAVIGPWLMAKIVIVLVVLAVAAHRDFAVLPRAIRAVGDGTRPSAALAGVRAFDRVLLLLALVVLFFAVGVARGR
jgi:putative copper resistance protein D